MDSAYPIANVEDEFARLRAQADLFRADADRMLSKIGLSPDWRCLDLCSGVGGITDLLHQHLGEGGEVLGLELDPAKIEAARAWASEQGLHRVSFRQGDGFATGLAPGSFDLVHARFALGIVPGGIGMLAHALELLKPGGIVFLEEAELGSIAVYPPHEAWERALGPVLACFEQLGSDVHLGRKLTHLLLAEGVEVLEVKPCNHALRSTDPMHFHIPLTLASMREAVAGMGLAEPGAIDAAVAELTEHLSKPDTQTISFTMMQVVGRKPGKTGVQNLATASERDNE